MNDRQLVAEVLGAIEETIRRAMTANDTALAALQAQQAQLTTDIATLATNVSTLIEQIGSDTSDDISAGVNDVVTALGTADAQVTSTNAAVQAAATGSTPPADVPSSTTAPPEPS